MKLREEYEKETRGEWSVELTFTDSKGVVHASIDKGQIASHEYALWLEKKLEEGEG